MSTLARVHAGIPAGGQFATTTRTESSVALGADEPFASLTDDDRDVFTQGECGVLAWDLHERTGWPVVIASDGGDGTTFGWTHAGVQRPDGLVVDVEGVHDWGDWLDAWYDEPEEGQDFTLEVVTDPAQMFLDLSETSPEVRQHSARVADAIAAAAS